MNHDGLESLVPFARSFDTRRERLDSVRGESSTLRRTGTALMNREMERSTPGNEYVCGSCGRPFLGAALQGEAKSMTGAAANGRAEDIGGEMGDRVSVSYHDMGGGTMHAANVTINSKAMAGAKK